MAKELTWQGKTVEEVKALDINQYMELVPARIRRCLKRGFTDAQKRLLKNLESGRNNVKTHCRNLVILPSMIGLTINVYNGKDFVPITITLEMMGHYLGEYSHSRRIVSHSSAGVGATRSSKSTSAR